ncbi:hypothetical protein AZE42_07504 [Rhizopogon vesiculosus]|uniref:Uncharacterized protein n=1 Tax=Rhizopogon vesiculosus TaxID=180088 RepID=A0A1J8PMA7_9AGAM|nr:hypothetical protein AZE42_07504 [Rhizopogon vesiculosus]
MALVLAPHPVRDHASRVTRAGSVLADATNVHRRIRPSASTKHYNPLFSLSSRPSKAPPTLCLSATCASSSLSQALLPSPADLPDVRNVIPFPSAFPADDVTSITDIVMLDGTVGGVDPLSFPPAAFSPYNDTTSPCSAQIRLRKRRSQAIATLSQPKGPRREKKAKSKEDNTSASPDAVTRKRSRKSWRQVADLQFLATVHRSIVARLYDSSACGIDGDPVDAQTLEGQDVLLARKIQKRLVDDYGCSLILDDVPATSHNETPMHPSGQDFCRSLHSTHLPSPNTPPPPSSPRSSPPPTSDPTPPILTMPQLIATLTIRYNDRCSTRSRSSWRARRAELSSDHYVERKSSLSTVAYAPRS